MTISPLYVEEGNLQLNSPFAKQVSIEKGLPSLGIAFALNSILPEVCQTLMTNLLARIRDIPLPSPPLHTEVSWLCDGDVQGLYLCDGDVQVYAVWSCVYVTLYFSGLISIYFRQSLI